MSALRQRVVSIARRALSRKRFFFLGKRYRFDCSGFVSTLSDPPGPLLQESPASLEGVWAEDESMTLTGTDPVHFRDPRVLRNATTDVLVTSADGSATYELDRDYRLAGDLGRFENKGFVDGIPFRLARTPESRIPDGATVLVSYDGADTAENGKLGPHVQYCPSDPVAVSYVGDTLRALAAKWQLPYLFIRADELSRVNSDSRCRHRGLSPTAILLEHLTFIRDSIHASTPGTRVAMWEDAFSPYHGGYQWGFTETGPAPPTDILQFVWFYDPITPLYQGWASLAHFQKFGLSTVGCPWFKLQAIREWAQVVGEARRRGWNCLGMMDTPWSGPPPFRNFRETAIVSWKIPARGDRRWVEFVAPKPLETAEP